MQPLYRADGPPLSVGEQLHRISEYEVLRAVFGLRRFNVLLHLFAGLLPAVLYLHARDGGVDVG